MTHVAQKLSAGDTGFLYNPDSRTAVRLMTLMVEHNVSVSVLADAIAGGERKTVQRWLDGDTIIADSREKIGSYFGVETDDLKPADHLARLRPLLVEVEKIRQEDGLKFGTVVGELKRLAGRS